MKRFSLCVFLFLFQWAYGQTCEETLRRAQISYDQGRLSEIPALLKACLENGFNKEEQIQAYRLLTQTYLLLNDNEKADQSMYQLLKLNPEYVPNENDPAKYKKLFRSYRTDAILGYGITLSGNFTNIQIQSSRVVYEVPGFYRPQAGLEAGLIVEYPLVSGTHYLEAGPNFQAANIAYQLNTVSEYAGVNTVIDDENLLMTQSFGWLSLPVSYKYQTNLIKSSAMLSEVQFTAAPSYLIFNQINISDSPDGTTTFDINELSAIRRRFNLSLGLGVNQKFKAGTGFITTGLQFNYLLFNIHQEGQVNNLPGGSFPYQDPDVFRLYSFELSLGYMFQWFKPKKIGG